MNVQALGNFSNGDILGGPQDDPRPIRQPPFGLAGALQLS